ncbi:hypothetical protein [Solidesulfovibrio sp.]|uniref:hypothetical protein n=1 Tax=Solidesulfovibrio sp. TaxID=2910990 RepID=UPI002624B490|nr:hypothetical protein [Solidesulfovibrio sp.]
MASVPGDKPTEKAQESAPTRDRRKQFAEWSAAHPVDAATRRAFLEARIEMVRTDPRLTPREKEAAIAGLRKALGED